VFVFDRGFVVMDKLIADQVELGCGEIFHLQFDVPCPIVDAPLQNQTEGLSRVSRCE
jgi:hypothetical protein